MGMLVEEILTQVQLKRTRLMVVGASAGAIEMLGRLLPALPATSSMAIMIVVHIPQDRPSLLTSIFQPRCALPVIEPNDKQAIEPGHLYFAPPGYHMLVEREQVVSLSADQPVNYSRPSIDVLFESAADAFGPQTLGIVLTGANRDGADGLRAVCDRGGLAIVQQPLEAESPTMPQSAWELCPEAFVLSVTQMTELFRRL